MLLLQVLCIFISVQNLRSQTIGELKPCPSDKKFCQNGGRCLVFQDRDIFCACMPIFTGQFCEISVLTNSPVTPTSTLTTLLSTSSAITVENLLCPNNVNICKNGGLCRISSGNLISCTCINDYSGR